jgi:hypothetical protein
MLLSGPHEPPGLGWACHRARAPLAASLKEPSFDTRPPLVSNLIGPAKGREGSNDRVDFSVEAALKPEAGTSVLRGDRYQDD